MMRLVFIAALLATLVPSAWADPPPGVSPEAWHIAELATVTHKQAQKENDKSKYLRAHALYQEYLAKNPDVPDATLTFFDAELLFKLERYDEAAKMYERALDLAPTSKRAAEIAYAYMVSLRNAMHADGREAPDAGTACPGAGPCTIPAELQRLLRAYDRYLAIVGDGGEHAAVEYRRARTYYEYHQYAKAAPLFDAIVAHQPQHELAVYSANLELDCWAMLKRYDELRAAIARFKKSPIWNDEKVRQQIEQVETALKKKP